MFFDRASMIRIKEITEIFPTLTRQVASQYFHKAKESEKDKTGKYYIETNRVKLLSVIEIMGFKYEDIEQRISTLNQDHKKKSATPTTRRAHNIEKK